MDTDGNMTFDELKMMAEYGLTPAADADDDILRMVNDTRPTFAPSLTGGMLSRIRDMDDGIMRHLFLCTGMSPLMLFDRRSLTIVDAMMLIAGGNDSSNRWAGSIVEQWDSAPSSLEEDMFGDIGRYIHGSERAVIMAPTPFKELVFLLMPFTDEPAVAMQRRRLGLMARKSEEYPTGMFDSVLSGILRSDRTPTDMEKTVTGPMTLYRGERDRSVHGGMSWTTDRSVAEGFASRFATDDDDAGTIYSCIVDPDDILAVYADDGEHEVLVDPLSGVMEHARAERL